MTSRHVGALVVVQVLVDFRTTSGFENLCLVERKVVGLQRRLRRQTYRGGFVVEEFDVGRERWVVVDGRAEIECGIHRWEVEMGNQGGRRRIVVVRVGQI